MQVTTFSDYALRVLMYLAMHAERRVTIDEIASAYGISAHHLTKVVHLLGRAALVETTRGKGGGLRLAVPVEAVRIGDVVHLCEGDDDYVECAALNHKHCRIAPSCRLSGIFGRAYRVFYDELNRHTLADLVREPTALRQLLAMR